MFTWICSGHKTSVQKYDLGGLTSLQYYCMMMMSEITHNIWHFKLFASRSRQACGEQPLANIYLVQIIQWGNLLVCSETKAEQKALQSGWPTQAVIAPEAKVAAPTLFCFKVLQHDYCQSSVSWL